MNLTETEAARLILNGVPVDKLPKLERFTIEVSRCSTKKTSRLPRREKPLRTLV